MRSRFTAIAFVALCAPGIADGPNRTAVHETDGRDDNGVLRTIAISGPKQRQQIYSPLRPGNLPEKLDGKWKVSLCISKGHAWIRYQHVESGDVVSIGRYKKRAGGWKDKKAKRWVYPKAPDSGVFMGMEQKYEERVKQGKYLLLSVIVEDPKIYLGEDGGIGHGSWRNNCVTHARDAWHFYSGEFYHLPRFHAPGDLLSQVLRRHPEVKQKRLEAD